MKIFNQIINLASEKQLQFIDLTEKVEEILAQSEIKDGTVTVFSRHTTLAIKINEKEQGFFNDFEQFISALLPYEKYYRHNDLTIRTENIVCSVGATDCLNGHSHCQHLLLGTSEIIPVSQGKMMLGTWQRIFAIELDNARQRQVVVQVMGE